MTELTLAVDIVTGSQPPKYTAEVVSRLAREVDCRFLASRGYGNTTLATAYRIVHHPLSVRRHRRQKTILHVDTQLLAYVLSYAQRPPTVLTCHDLAQLHHEYDDPSYVRRGLANRALYRLIARGIAHADGVVAVSEFTRNEMLRAGLRNTRGIDVVPMGVEPSSYRPRPREECVTVRTTYGLPPNRPLVLFVGTEHPRKNIQGLLRAFSIVPGSDAVLVVVSEPRHPQHGELEELVSALGIASRVAFVKRVAEADMPRLYSAADVVVLPSFYEGFGLPPLEGMACGTPVAVSRAASLPEVVGNAGLYFDPANEQDIAAAISRILTDPSLRDELRARGLDRARAFPWEHTVRGLLTTYRKVWREAT